MKLPDVLSSAGANASKRVSRWFPVPRYLDVPSVGVDVSDASIKWLALERRDGGKQVRSWGELPLESGIVVNGAVKSPEKLAEALRDVRSACGAIRCAHAALPEEDAYVFTVPVPPSSSRAQIQNLVEFELEDRVPLPGAAAVYDFDDIQSGGNEPNEVGVVVFPKELAENYVAAFARADFQLLSLELEASSIARTVMGPGSKEVTLLVDFGRARTGLALLKRGVPIFTSTVAVGGDSMMRAVMDKLGLSEEEALRFNNDQGLIPEEGKQSPGLDALSGVASALADEVARHYHYWDTRRDERGERMTPVERVLLVGGSANLKGLSDYIAARVQARVEKPNVWQRVCSFDDYIPPIDRYRSMQFATAIGLALRAF